jgi:hypothetical protein
MAFEDAYRFSAIPFWTQKPKEKVTHIVGLTCRFPPNWSTVIGIRVYDYSGEYRYTYIWNSRHPILRAIDASGWEWVQNSFRDTLDPLPLKSDVLNNKSRAASWLVLCLEKQAKDLWNGLNDRDPLFLKELWMLLFKSRSRSDSRSTIPVCHWVQDVSILNVLTPEQWSSYSGNWTKFREQYMPDPGPEWRLEIIRDDSTSDSDKS